MNMMESVKTFLSRGNDEKVSSKVEPTNQIKDLTYDQTHYVGSFFDDNENEMTYSDRETLLKLQADKIKTYRKLSMEADVSDAIDSIVNEIIFSIDDKQPVQLTVNEENEALKTALEKSFEKVTKLMNVRRNIYAIVKSGYVDGQLVFHTPYKKDITKGIESISLIDPVLFMYDTEIQKYKYSEAKDYENNMFNRGTIRNPESYLYDLEEIVREDFGLYNNNMVLGYLEYAIKSANVLQTLEDLLVPMRFSRSVSRRVFNVDIGDIASKRGAEVMKEYQNKFKYKKFYNNETGEIANQQHITSMVEDYWFANRSGGKGTTVDTLDETGNLGELDDIIYYSKKLYRSMKLPSSRSPYSDEIAQFDYDSSQTTQEDVEFYMLVSRLRMVYTTAFKEILKREVVSTKILSEDEWLEKEDIIEIRFANENSFIEKMKTSQFMAKLDVFSTVQEYQGKLFSVQTILRDVFRFSDKEIEDEFKLIQKEEKDPLYANFYKEEEDDF